MTIDDIRAVDPGDMYGAISGFPMHFRGGRESASAVDPRLSMDDIDTVLVAGMGGSAISGDLLQALASSQASVPVFVSRSYTLPAFVGDRTLVVVSSYSGNTEETLAAMDEAEERGARIICITTGGSVRERAAAAGHPYYQLPSGLQPRAALGYSLSTILVMAEQIGLLSAGAEAWGEAVSLLEERGKELSDTAGNEALAMAESLRGHLPFVYSGSGLLAPVNTRWCCQLEENAKVLAHGNVFPELNHNEIVGWTEPAPVHEEIAVVALRDRVDHPRVARRMDLTRQLIEEKAGLWLEVETRGGSELARMLSLVQLGDWISFYLAIIRGVDPTPVTLIDRLKQSL